MIEYIDFDDVLIRPRHVSNGPNSRKKVDLTQKYTFNHGISFSGIPIIASNLDTVGTFQMAEALFDYGISTAIHKHYPDYEWEKARRNYIPYYIKSIGINTSLPLDIIPERIMVDVPNAYIDDVYKYIRNLREIYPDITIIAGNIATAEGVRILAQSGVDIVKVGIGSGEFCTTRYVTGVGVPQLSAITECALEAKYYGVKIISDGGCKNPGDIVKAFVAGADFVMLGSMLAGHDECGGEIVVRDNKDYMLHYGMSSVTANEKHNGGLRGYRAAEGQEKLIPYKGSVENTIQHILGGIRSACTYVGAWNLEDLRNNGELIRVNNIKG